MPIAISLTQGKFALISEEDFDLVHPYRWHVIQGQRKSGTPYKTYAARKHEGKTRYMHHEILPKQRGRKVDHINGDTLDNRRENLRYVTSRQSCMNTFKTCNKKTSRYKGVHWSKAWGRWRAQIMFEGRTKMLGGFESEQQAAKAYDLEASKLFGVFAKLNFS